VELQVTDEFIRGVVVRARELGLLDSAGPVEGWLATAEAAAYLGCSRGQLLNLVSAGHIPRRYRKGHKARFRPSDLDAYVEGAGPRGTRVLRRTVAEAGAGTATREAGAVLNCALPECSDSSTHTPRQNAAPVTKATENILGT
jgi:excisionase family DNA binding protein